MVERILLPLDGSQVAEMGLVWAAALHRAFGSRIILFRVVEAEPDRPGMFSESMGWRLAEAEGRSYLNAIARELERTGIDADVDVRSGNPSDEILAGISRWKADMVILSSHGEGGAESFPCGGTSSKVIASAGTSILLNRSRSHDAHAARGLRRVVVPLDGSPRADWALKLGAELARNNDADLLLVHVVARPDVLEGALAPLEAEALADRLVEVNTQAGLRLLKARRRQLSSPDLPIHLRVAAASSVPRAIQGLASRKSGSLLVLSAHGRSAGAGGAYGGVASNLLSHGAGPVLVFQDLPQTPLSRPGRRVGQARVATSAAAGTRIE